MPTREIKSSIAMAKAAFSRKKTFCTSKLDLNLQETSEVLHLEQNIVNKLKERKGYWNWKRKH